MGYGWPYFPQNEFREFMKHRTFKVSLSYRHNMPTENYHWIIRSSTGYEGEPFAVIVDSDGTKHDGYDWVFNSIRFFCTLERIGEAESESLILFGVDHVNNLLELADYLKTKNCVAV